MERSLDEKVNKLFDMIRREIEDLEVYIVDNRDIQKTYLEVTKMLSKFTLDGYFNNNIDLLIKIYLSTQRINDMLELDKYSASTCLDLLHSYYDKIYIPLVNISRIEKYIPELLQGEISKYEEYMKTVEYILHAVLDAIYTKDKERLYTLRNLINKIGTNISEFAKKLMEREIERLIY